MRGLRARPSSTPPAPQGRAEQEAARVRTYDVEARPALQPVFPVQVFQDLGAAEALETALHIIVEPFQGLGSQKPGEDKEL